MNLFFYLGVALIAFGIGVLFGIAYGSSNATKGLPSINGIPIDDHRTITNSTTEMQFGDRWSCGYINATTTLNDLRNCFRD